MQGTKTKTLAKAELGSIRLSFAGAERVFEIPQFLTSLQPGIQLLQIATDRFRKFIFFSLKKNHTCGLLWMLTPPKTIGKPLPILSKYSVKSLGQESFLTSMLCN